MSERLFYPTLSADHLVPLKVMQEQFAQHPNYFDSADCAFSDEDRLWLKKHLRKQHEFEELALLPADLAIWSQVEREIIEVYNETKKVYANLGNDDTTEKLAALRLRSTSLKELVALQERSANLASFHAFLDTILNFVEAKLGPDGRAELQSLMEARK